MSAMDDLKALMALVATHSALRDDAAIFRAALDLYTVLREAQAKGHVIALRKPDGWIKVLEIQDHDPRSTAPLDVLHRYMVLGWVVSRIAHGARLYLGETEHVVPYAKYPHLRLVN